MHAVSPCPEEYELGQLLLGRIDDNRERVLLDHLAGCDRCAALASTLHIEDDLVCAMRERSPILAAVQGTVDTLVERAREGVRAALPGLAPAAAAELPGEVGPYQVLKLLGSGGMGVVYLARHRQLGRLVALKLIGQGAWTDESRRARFRREAEVVARLRHANVVTLYEVGEWQGAPYFAMEYVEGGNLAERLAESPLPPRRAADVVARVAQAVQYAHGQGVVHRDLKPANVLLGADGTPKVTDFGLARQLDDEQGQTRPGDVLGTPSYMAPEQIDHVGGAGPACDVYALGAILYESLTGRPPFKGATPLATLEQVRYAEPVAPGQLQPGLPRDLQVSCLKCLEKAPARRYATAQALADDLRRWLEGRPILARPAGVGERVLKWARRRPALAALVAVSAFALAVVIGGAVGYERRLRQELGNTERALEQARAEGERADDNSGKAREALRKMLLHTTGRGWSEVPRLRELRRGMAEEALAFYEQMANQDSNQAQVRQDVAWACLEAGKQLVGLGRSRESRVSIERAVEMAAGLVREAPDNESRRLLYADALAWLGNSHDLGEGSIKLQKQAADELEALLRTNPAAAGARGQLAGIQGTLGGSLIQKGRQAEAIPHLKRSLELNSELARAHPENVDRRQQLARTRINLARAHFDLKQNAQGEQQQELASADLEQLYASNPRDLDVIEALAALRVNRSYTIAAAGQVDEAIRYLSLNLPMLELALKQEPDDKTFHLRAHQTYGLRAIHLQSSGRLAEAAASWEKAVPYGDPVKRVWHLLDLAALWLNAGDYRKGIALADELRPELAKLQHPNAWRRLAADYDQAAALAGKDAKLTSEEREKILAHCRGESQAATFKRLGAEFLKLLPKKPPAGKEKR